MSDAPSPSPPGLGGAVGRGARWSQRCTERQTGLNKGWEGVGESSATDLVETRERK